MKRSDGSGLRTLGLVLTAGCLPTGTHKKYQNDTEVSSEYAGKNNRERIDSHERGR